MRRVPGLLAASALVASTGWTTGLPGQTVEPPRTDEASRLARIAALEAEGPASFPAYLNALVQTSTFYTNQGRYAEALPLLRRAHRVSEQNLGPQHPTTDQLRVTIVLMERFAPGPQAEDRADPAR